VNELEEILAEVERALDEVTVEPMPGADLLADSPFGRPPPVGQPLASGFAAPTLPASVPIQLVGQAGAPTIRSKSGAAAATPSPLPSTTAPQLKRKTLDGEKDEKEAKRFKPDEKKQ